MVEIDKVIKDYQRNKETYNMVNKTKTEKIYSQKKFVTVLSIISFSLLVIILTIIAIKPAAHGYENSIYTAFPWYFWLFFIGMNFSAFLLLIFTIFSTKKSNVWVFGFLILLIGNFILILLPFFRGYCFYGGATADTFSHIGYVKEIFNTGYVSSDNFYPIIHIFIYYFSDLTNIPVTTIVFFIPAFFSILYPLFVFLLVKSFTKDINKSLLIAALSFPLQFSFFNLDLHPVFFSFILTPLIIYLYHKKNNSQIKFPFSVIIIMLCFLIVFFHPLTTIAIIVIFTIFIVGNLFNKKIEYSNSSILFILTLIFIVWYTSFNSSMYSMKLIYENIRYGSSYSLATSSLSTLGTANLTMFQTIWIFFIKYSEIIIYAVLSFLFLMVIIRKFSFYVSKKNLEFIYGLQVVATFLFAAVMMISNFSVIELIRCLLFFIMMSTIASGLFIFYLIEKNNKQDLRKKKLLFITLIIGLLFFNCTICTFNVYSSPYTYEINRQFTYQGYEGTAWFVKNRELNIQVYSDAGFNFERMEHYMNGVSDGNTRIKKELQGTPTHFGYLQNETVFQTFNYTVTYLVTTQTGRLAVNAFPKNIQPRVRQWTQQDFVKLNQDPTVNKIYLNNEVECWLISK
jgi:hypothetical protein